MAFLSDFNISIHEVSVLAQAARAAYSGEPLGSLPNEGWTISTTYNVIGAQATVFTNGTDYIVSFRGTDQGILDWLYYPQLFDGTYILNFSPLLASLVASAPSGAHFSFTGHSLGGGAVNQLASIASFAFDGRFEEATFVGFASPVITNASGILNIGSKTISSLNYSISISLAHLLPTTSLLPHRSI